MGDRIPSRKLAAQLAKDNDWQASDVVVAGVDKDGGAVRLTRAQAAVPASLVRRWLIVKGGNGEPLLRVVGDFISGDGVLFTVRARDLQSSDPSPLASP
ncbi:MAG TPA: hypothetical protein VHL79_08045 [Ramlibacter sp.]|nr:hypothetical protein [Ramlibacter sp.]